MLLVMVLKSEEGCTYVTSITSKRPCSRHPDKNLIKSSDEKKCLVEFAYIYPKDFTTDTRRWICGFVHHQKEATMNLHNHPIHGSARMCSKVKECIQSATTLNPSITPTELYKGVGMPFIPGAIDKGSSHLGRISRQVQKAKHSTPSGSTWDVTKLDEIDSQDARNSGDKQEDINIHQLCRPYLVSTGMENGIKYIHTMNPLMSDLLARSKFVEADITYNENLEYKYLFNMAAFNESTMRWMVVSRVRLNSQSSLAYKLAYEKTFSKCKSDHPEFSPGTTLLGVVTDWSDAEIQGLGGAVGTETARKLLKGCSVHWDRSWQRMRDRVAHTAKEKQLFSKIAHQIRNMEMGQYVCLSFQVLSGEVPATALVGNIENFTLDDAKFIDTECDWSLGSNWANWWI